MCTQNMANSDLMSAQYTANMQCALCGPTTRHELKSNNENLMKFFFFFCTILLVHSFETQITHKLLSIGFRNIYISLEKLVWAVNSEWHTHCTKAPS